MAYKEKQLNGSAAKALSQAWGSTNADMAKGKRKQPDTKKKGAAKKAGNGK